MRPVVTLLTDFGTADGYVAEMKGVILTRAPEAEVVDPGVGSARAALAVESDGRWLVGPDNGLLSPALLVTGARAVSLPVPASAAPTFHGRDVFAPAGASLALGTPIDALGSPLLSPVIRRTPEPRRLADGSIEGQVITIDRFGNAVTNLLALRATSVEVNGTSLPVRRSYADVGPGEAIALVGSTGLIELAVRDGHGAKALGLSRGSVVVLRLGADHVLAPRC